jgi:hypothetical protein
MDLAQMSVVEYALDVVEECQDQPGGLEHLVQCQVTFFGTFFWVLFFALHHDVEFVMQLHIIR